MKRFNTNLFGLSSALCLIAVFTFFVACNREEPVATDQQQADAIKVADGRLHFASEELFRTTIKQLAQKQNSLAEWEKQFSGFISMRTAFKQLTDQDYQKIGEGNLAPYKDIVAIIGEGEEKEAVRVITDGILATLVSKDGFLYIANKAYKFGWNQMYVVEDFTSGKLKGMNFEAGQATGEFKTLPITHRIEKIQNQPLPSGKTAASIRCIVDYEDYNVNGRNKRLAGDIDYSGSEFYSSVTVMTKHQQRITGIWYAKNTGYVQAQGSATSINGYTINFDTGREYNDGYCQWSFTEQVNNLSTTHQGYCDDGVTRRCNLYL